MAKTFKNLLGDDIVTTRTLLHEAIPITGTISSGTYQVGNTTTETNIKTFTHGMFESVYDYPYLSSSANHIFDLTYGCSSNVSSSGNTQNAKKMNIYNQMAQVLMGYDVSGNIRKFDSDGNLETTAGQMDHCFFLNFSRLLTKDEIKKNSFRLQMFTSGTVTGNGNGRGAKLTFGDYASATEYRTAPGGDYGLIFSASGDSSDTSKSVGLVFYQAGIAVLTSSIFKKEFGPPGNVKPSTANQAENQGIVYAQTGSTIEVLAGGLRHCIHDLDFNNTIELNSSIHFCRINHNEFNYSANPTYVSGSKVVVKNNINDLPLSYITTVGLYSPENELLAVAKLSEPIRKDPNTELTLRVRLDY
jgi:hypothetical protein